MAQHTHSSLQSLRDFVPSHINFDRPLHTRGIRKPAVHVGEYLPPARSGETEIARISLASTLGDVVSIRARRSGKLVILSVYDEYQTVFTDFQDTFNGLPTQGELVDLLCSFRGEDDERPYLPGVIENNGYETADEAMDFITLDSQLYPDLETLFRVWIAAHGGKPMEKEDTVEGRAEESLDAPGTETADVTETDRLFLEGLLNYIVEGKARQTPWQSLMGTLCFNIWHHTNEDFLQTGDRKSLGVSFLAALNLFQQWDRLYLSKEFDRAAVSEGAGAFARSNAQGLLEALPGMLSLIEQKTPAKGSLLSHAFAVTFNRIFMEIYDKAIGSENPLNYFQAGVEILFLLAPGLAARYPELNQRLLDVRPFDAKVEEIIEAINALETT